MPRKLSTLGRDLCPPVVWRGLRSIRRFIKRRAGHSAGPADGAQDLAIYWTAEFAESLETWGEGNAWSEIQLCLCTHRGSVLDIACGTGAAMERLARFDQLEVHGCDVSDFLIGKAIARGLPASNLRVCDARDTGYDDQRFHFSYSIGSLEHFDASGIEDVLREARRITRHASFHHVPTARDGKDHGWISPYQSYYNNSVEWWLQHFRAVFPRVSVHQSAWEDDNSVGSWFVCEQAGDAGAGDT